MITTEIVSNLLIMALSYANDNQIWRKIDQRFQKVSYELFGRYKNTFLARYGSVKILDMSTGKNLSEIYVPPQLINSADQLNKSLVDPDLVDKRSIVTTISMELTNEILIVENEFLIIYGPIGSGKSTLLRHIGCEMLCKGSQHQCQSKKIPVYIDLNNQQVRNISIEEIIQYEFEIANLPDSADLTKITLEKEGLLLLIDGLDEIHPSLQNTRLSEIRDFVDRYSGNKYIIARKRLNGSSYLSRFSQVQILPFNSQNTKQYIRNWFRDKDESAGLLLLNEIEKTSNFPKDICQTPLLLTSICLLYEHTQASKIDHVLVYERILKTLLKDWPQEKGQHQPIDLCHYKEMVLSELSLYTYRQKGATFSKKEFIAILKDNYASDKDTDIVSPGDLLSQLEHQNGFLYAQQDGSYCFTYSSLQQYLVACYFAHAESGISTLVENHIFDRRWAYIFPLAASIHNKNQVIDELLSHVNKFCVTQKIQKIVAWSESMTQTEYDDNRYPAKVAYCIFVLFEILLLYQDKFLFRNSLFRCNQKIHDIILSLDSRLKLNYLIEPKIVSVMTPEILVQASIGIVDKLLSNQIFASEIGLASFWAKLIRVQNWLNKNSNKKVVPIKEAFSRYLYTEWISVLQINQEILLLTMLDFECLLNYLYGYDLALKCRESFHEKPNSCWFQVEHSFLLFQHSE